MSMPLEFGGVLSRFPGPVTLYPSRARQIKALAGGALFAVMGGILIATEDGLAGWLCIALSGIGTIVAAISMLPGANSLTLDKDGFNSTALFRIRNRSRWQDVTNFQALAAFPPAPADVKLVWYNDSQWNGWKLAKFDTAMFGYNAMLGDTYGMSAEELAQLMAQWRNRAVDAQ